MKGIIGSNENISNLSSLVNQQDSSYKRFRIKSKQHEMNAYDKLYKVSERRFSNTSPLVRGYRIAVVNSSTKQSDGKKDLIYGTLSSTKVSNGIAIYDNYHEPQIIANLLFYVNEDIYPSADINEILNKVSVVPGLEILDSPINKWFSKFSVGDLIDGCNLVGEVVLGQSTKLDSTDYFNDFKINLKCDGEFANSENYDVVKVNPLEAMKLLTNKLAAKGSFLKKGMIITAGSYTVLNALYRGEYHANFGLLGDVTLKVR